MQQTKECTSKKKDIKKKTEETKDGGKAMVYTVTFNPALDYVVRMDEDLLPGMTNRSASEEYYFGGKGINVSIVLAELGIKSTALGFVAGFTGRAIEEGVAEAGINTDFIHLKEGLSRINVKLKALEEETEINAQGPVIDEDSQMQLLKKLSKLVEGDMLILAGSIPGSLPNDVYEKILYMLMGKGIEFIVDATRDLLTNVLKYHPFLVKPNNYELEEIVGRPLNTEEEIYKGALELQERGARNVLVSMAEKGAILVDEYGKRHKIGVPDGEVRNSVGAGDSMIAGFIAGYMKTKDYDQALKLGAAAGSATAFSDGLAKADYIEELYKNVGKWG